MKKNLIGIFIFSFYLIGYSFANTGLNLYLNGRFEYLTKNNPLFSGAVVNIGIYDESGTQIGNTKNQEKSAYFPNEPTQITTDSKGIIISEIFFNGADERIELTNTGGEIFSGILSISGAKSSLLKKSFNILPKKSVLIGDNLSQILDRSYIVYSGLGLSIPDKSEINVSLIFSGTEIDNFFVPSGIVKNLNEKTSFEKLSIGNSYIISGTSIDRKNNISGDWVANPGFFNDFITGGAISTGLSFDRYEINNLPSKDISIFRLKFILTTGIINNDIFNSYVNPIDALLINRYYLKLVNLSGIYLKTADVNGDGKVNPVDALLINRYYLKTINNFSLGLYFFEDRDIAVCLSSDGITINTNEIINCKKKYNAKLGESAKANPIILIAILKNGNYLAGSKDAYFNSDSRFFNNDPIYIKTLHVGDVNGGK